MRTILQVSTGAKALVTMLYWALLDTVLSGYFVNGRGSGDLQPSSKEPLALCDINLQEEEEKS